MGWFHTLESFRRRPADKSVVRELCRNARLLQQQPLSGLHPLELLGRTVPLGVDT